MFRRMSDIDTVPTYNLQLNPSAFVHDRCEENVCNDHLFAIHLQQFPALCERGNFIARRLLHNELFPEEAISYLEEARSAYLRVLNWTRQNPSIWQPRQSYLLPQAFADGQLRYPKRADSYASVVQAADCNYMRTAWIVLLTIMAKVRRRLEIFMDPALARRRIETAEIYEKEIQDLADDICASIPYYMSPNHRLDMADPASILKYYPHTAADLRLPVEIGPSVIRSLCHLMYPLIHTSIAETIPVSQRQWARAYMWILNKQSSGPTQLSWPFPMGGVR